MEKLEKRIDELECLVNRITGLRSKDPGNVFSVPDLHHVRHETLGQKSAEHDRAISYNWDAIKELRRDVADLKLALLRLASDEAVHDLLK